MSLSPVAGATIRADIAAVVEEGLGADENLVGLKVMPPLPVEVRAGQYPKLEIGGGRLLAPTDVKRRGPTSDYPRKHRQWGSDTYTCLEYGLEDLLGLDSIMDLGRFFDAEATTARLTQTDLLLAHERRVATKIIDPTVFALITSSTAYTAANVNSFDLGYDLDLAKEEIRKRGESVAAKDLKLVIPGSLYPLLRTSERLKQRLFGMSGALESGPLDLKELAMALEVREVLVARSTYNSAPEGATADLTDIWPSTHIWIGRVSEDDNLMAGGAGRTMFWKQDGRIVTVESYPVEEKRSLAIRVRQSTDEKIINANAGQLLVTQAA